MAKEIETLTEQVAFGPEKVNQGDPASGVRQQAAIEAVPEIKGRSAKIKLKVGSIQVADPAPAEPPKDYKAQVKTIAAGSPEADGITVDADLARMLVAEGHAELV